jgi:excisionase family DNA binding protein
MVYTVFRVMHIRLGKKIYLSIHDAAEMLGITVPTLRNWTKRGVLHAKRHPVNQYRLYLQGDVERLVKRLEKGGVSSDATR